jgi:hypothetical protein
MALRVLRPKRSRGSKFPEFTRELTERAHQQLAQDAQFQHYLKHITSGEGDVEGQEELGRFQLVRDCQLEITRIPEEDTLAAPVVDDISAVQRVEIGINVPLRRSNRAHRPPHYHQSPYIIYCGIED